MRFLISAILWSAVLWSAVSPDLCADEATSTLTFAGGGSSEDPNPSEVDAFPGLAGQGWADGWKLESQSTDETKVEAAVKSDSPFAGGGDQYLQIKYTRLGDGTTGARAGVMRSFDGLPGAGGLDVTTPYKVRFLFRVDDFSEPLDSPQDHFNFSGETSERLRGIGANSMWALSLSGGGGGWRAWNGDGAGDATPINFGPDNLGIEPGTIFGVEVHVDSVTNRYDVHLHYAGTVYRASDNNEGEWLGVRDNYDLPNATTLSFRSTRSGEGRSVTWALDYIQVLSAPLEP